MDMMRRIAIIAVLLIHIIGEIVVLLKIVK